VAKQLGAENFVFWGGREGYQSLLNTNVRRELDHMANFFRMVVAYKKKIGFNGTLLIEPKPKEPTKHQYDYDAQTTIAFLKTYYLDKEFKLNIEPNHTTMAGHSYEHDIAFASGYNMLGSIDANTGDPSLGWDTDMFVTSVKDAAAVMKIVIEQGGLGTGGLNFDAKVRRESTDLEDMFIAHIGAMDCFAHGLKAAAKMVEDGLIAAAVKERYASWDEEFGKKIEHDNSSLEEMEQFVLKHGETAKVRSAKEEKFNNLFASYL